MNHQERIQDIYRLLEKLVDNTLVILEKIYDPYFENIDAQLSEREDLIKQLREQASFMPLWRKDERLIELFGKVNIGTARLIEVLREKIDQIKKARRQNVVARLAAAGYLGGESKAVALPITKA